MNPVSFFLQFVFAALLVAAFAAAIPGPNAAPEPKQQLISTTLPTPQYGYVVDGDYY